MVIVIISLIELFIEAITRESNNSIFTALRAFRLMRVFKIAKFSESLSILLESIIKTLGSLVHFSLLLFLILYVYTLLGMQFFAGKQKYDDNQFLITNKYQEVLNVTYSPIGNFDNFVASFTTVFQVLTQDGWSGIMYNCARSTNIYAA